MTPDSEKVWLIGVLGSIPNGPFGAKRSSGFGTRGVILEFEVSQKVRLRSGWVLSVGVEWLPT